MNLPAAPHFTALRLFGLPTSEILLPSRTNDADTTAPAGQVRILYFGFKAGVNEVRIPSGRVMRFPEEAVLESGEIAEFAINGANVHFYDLPFDAEVHEDYPDGTSKQIGLGALLVTRTEGTFAALVATPSRAPISRDDLEGLSSDEMFAIAKEMIAGNDIDVTQQAHCTGYCQTRRSTSFGIFTISDAWGADCD